MAIHAKSYKSQKLQALVVEDDLLTGEIIRARLERCGVSTIWCETLEDAREHLVSKRMDLMILDLSLPDGHGFELIDFARATHANKSVPIIVVTGDTRPEVLTKALGKDKAIFLSNKPIEWSCLDYVLESTVLAPD